MKNEENVEHREKLFKAGNSTDASLSKNASAKTRNIFSLCVDLPRYAPKNNTAVLGPKHLKQELFTWLNKETTLEFSTVIKASNIELGVFFTDIPDYGDSEEKTVEIFREIKEITMEMPIRFIYLVALENAIVTERDKFWINASRKEFTQINFGILFVVERSNVISNQTDLVKSIFPNFTSDYLHKIPVEIIYRTNGENATLSFDQFTFLGKKVQFTSLFETNNNNNNNNSRDHMEIEPSIRCPDNTRFSVDKYAEVLFQFIEEKNTEKISEILEHYIPSDLIPNVVNSVKDRRSALQKALITKNVPLVRKLLQNGANLYAIPPGGNSTFHLAIYDSNILAEIIKIVRELIAQDKPIPQECGKVVYYAIFEKKFECLKMLLEKDYSPFLQFVNIDIMNVTPLHVAFGEGHFDAVKILIEAGADVNKCVQKDEIYPVHVAAAKGNYESFCYLIQTFTKRISDRLDKLKEYSNIDEYLTLRTKDTKMTPYHFASFRGNWRVLDYMLRLSLTALNYQSASGMAAIHYGVSEAHDSVVATLLPHKPNLFLEDKNGNNAIVYAGFKNRYHCGALLMNHINQHRFEFTNGELKRDILLDKKIWLVLSVVDTTKVIEVSVTFKPDFEQLMKDIDVIRSELTAKAVDVESKDLKWKKFQLLHLKYKGKDEIISKGSGILRDFLPHAAEIILGSDLFYPINGGRSFGLTYHEHCDETILENMRRIGFFLALAILTNPIHFPLAKYIFKLVAGELVAPVDFIGEGMIDHLQMIEQLSAEEIAILDLPNTTTIHTSQHETKEIPLSDDLFVTKESFGEYKNKLIYTHLYGGGKKELLNAITQGFYSLLPLHFLKIINEHHIIANLYQTNLVTSDELQQLISELPLNVEEWESHTSYVRCDRNTKEVEWFWHYIYKSSEETRRKVLQFSTGSPMLPIGGFKYLKSEKIPYTIELISSEETYRLPTARTCVYTIALPTYTSQQTFEDALTYAISNCEGFHFV